MKKLTITGIVLGVSLLGGCGGGGGTPAVVTPTTRAIVTNNLRNYTAGDNIQYSMTGSVSRGGVITTLTGSSIVSISTNSSPLDPAGIIRSVSTTSMTGTLSNGTPFTSNVSTYYSQDTIGNFNIYGDSKSQWITTPASGFVTAIKSPITIPSSWINSYTQQNGDVTSSTTTVLGKAIVTTGMGVFETYKIQTDSTTTLAAGGTNIFSQIRYAVPSIGSIKIIITGTSTDALGIVSTSQFTIIANTTNIAF